jgi:hypothetical protein
MFADVHISFNILYIQEQEMVVVCKFNVTKETKSSVAVRPHLGPVWFLSTLCQA